MCDLEEQARRCNSAYEFLKAVEEQQNEEAYDDWLTLNDLWTEEYQSKEWEEAMSVSNVLFGEDETRQALERLERI